MNSAVRVDFYVLGSSEPDARERYACRVAEKAWQQAHRVYLHTDSRASAERLNDLLWTFRQSSFVPHELSAHPPDLSVPVLIGFGECPREMNGVLINLDRAIPAFYPQFERVVELVTSDDGERRAARARWRQYQEHGCEIQSHNV